MTDMMLYFEYLSWESSGDGVISALCSISGFILFLACASEQPVSIITGREKTV